MSGLYGRQPYGRISPVLLELQNLQIELEKEPDTTPIPADSVEQIIEYLRKCNIEPKGELEPKERTIAYAKAVTNFILGVVGGKIIQDGFEFLSDNIGDFIEIVKSLLDSIPKM